MATFMEMINLSIIIPAFNEEQSIASTLTGLLEAIKPLADQYEIIIIDDGSVDTTAHCVRLLQEKNPNIKLIQHGRNRGYGAALRTGITAATLDWIFITDADGQLEYSSLHSFMYYRDHYDMIVGYRHSRQDNPYRVWISTFGNWIVRRSLGIKVRDVGCAFKLIRTQKIQPLCFKHDGNFFNTELFIEAQHHQLRIKEIPITHLPRIGGHSTGGNPVVILKNIRGYIDCFFKQHWGRAKGQSRP